MTIRNPVLVIGAPRSGTTLLFRALSLHPELWHLPGESHRILEGPFHPEKRGYRSNRLTAEDLDEALRSELRRSFYDRALNLSKILNPAGLAGGNTLWGRAVYKAGQHILGPLSRLGKPRRLRLVEKTPKNILRIPFLLALFPDAYFVWLRRRPEDNVDSLIAGWRSQDRLGPFVRDRFASSGYPVLPGLDIRDYAGRVWKFALVPGWERLRGMSVADIAAWQYYQCNRIFLDDMPAIPADRLFVLKHEEFIADAQGRMDRLLEFVGLPSSEAVARFVRRLPRVNESTRRRDRGALRYPDEVRAAIARVPGFDDLRAQMGYTL